MVTVARSRVVLLGVVVTLGLAGLTAAAAQADPAQADPTAAVTPDATASGLRTVSLTVPASLRSAPFDVERRVAVPKGWTAAVWARVPGARLAVWAPDGSMLVSQPYSGAVRRLRPGGATVPKATTLVSGLRSPHGLAFDGSTLYVAESNQVDAYTYRNGALSNRRVVVGGLPDDVAIPGYSHALKSVAVGPDHALYVDIGSTGNTTASDRTQSPERASVLRVPPGGGTPTVFAHGVRNGTGLAVDPTGVLWTAVNNRDNIEFPYHRDWTGDGTDDFGAVIQSYVNDHPVEEIARLTAGRDLGWPYCNPDPDVSPGVPNSRRDFSKPPFVRDAELNADGRALDCGALAPVEQSIPAHSAPLGMSFLTSSTLPGAWHDGAVVAFHGSWNASPPRAPGVDFLPWKSGTARLGSAQPLMTGFQLPDGSRWGRPVDAVAGPDAALYVTDDASGSVYRLVPPAA